MKLLVITQKVDKNDPVLGFFHRWLEEFAKHFEFVTVICLERGEYSLPENVKVFSLGKEKNVKHRVFNKVQYIFRFYKYIWQERRNYDVVFVHMNQEYILLGWKFWKFWGKKIFMWRNHAKGNFWTRYAVWVSDKVFCTSQQSFTAQFTKTKLMPVGIDTDFFKPDPKVIKEPNSALFLGRISPVKKVLKFIDWVEEYDYKATIAGPILPKDREYGELVKHRVFNNPMIEYVGPVNQNEARRLYQEHQLYVNLTPSGSMDKTIFEARACGMELKVENPAAQNINIEEHSLKVLMERLKAEIK